MKTLNYYLITLFLVLFCSCDILYIPTVVNTPVFTEKNELHLSGYIGTTGLNVQTAYSLNNHLALTLNGKVSSDYSLGYEYYDNSSGYESYDSELLYSSNHSSIDLSVGYYNNFNKNYLWAIYGGIGTGSDVLQTSDINTNYIKTYIQPQISIYSDLLEMSVALRFLNNSYSSGNPFHNTSGNNSISFLEPVLTGKAGKGIVKFVFQGGLSVPLSSELTLIPPDEESFLSWQPFILSAGLQVRISDLWKKR